MRTLEGLQQRLFNNWNFIRFLRLALAIFILVNAVRAEDRLIMAGGIFILGQTLLNVGCCGFGGCAIDQEQTPANGEISYEEINSES